MNQPSQGPRRPLITYFLQRYPDPQGGSGDENGVYCEEAGMSLTPDGLPLHLSRSSTPPTSAFTPGHTIPAGYTPSGKWRSAKVMPGKMDRRAGK
jgi:hypothetical protein